MRKIGLLAVIVGVGLSVVGCGLSSTVEENETSSRVVKESETSSRVVKESKEYKQEDWRQAYKDYVSSLDNISVNCFQIRDFHNDGIPELYVRYSDYSKSLIFLTKDGEVKELALQGVPSWNKDFTVVSTVLALQDLNDIPVDIEIDEDSSDNIYKECWWDYDSDSRDYKLRFESFRSFFGKFYIIDGKEVSQDDYNNSVTFCIDSFPGLGYPNDDSLLGEDLFKTLDDWKEN